MNEQIGGLTVLRTWSDGNSDRRWVVVAAPWDQYNKDKRPGEYMDTITGVDQVSGYQTFLARFDMRYPGVRKS